MAKLRKQKTVSKKAVDETAKVSSEEVAKKCGLRDTQESKIDKVVMVQT